MSKKIVLDAGHGYNTAGKRTPNGIREWSLNNAVCNYIAEYLKEYDVIITRTDDTTGKTDISLSRRVERINSINPDIFISIHHNAYNGKWGTHGGIEVYSHTQGTATDKKLANIIAPLLAKETGLKNRGPKTMQLAILGCKTSIPAVLCEGGFMDSTVDNPIITSEKGQRAYAKAVVNGIVEFLKLNKKTNTVSSPIKTNEVLADEVIKGLWGVGQDRLNRLTKAGYNYTAIQNIVNNKLKGNTKAKLKSTDEIAKEVIAGKWGNGSERKNRLTKAGYSYSEIQKRVNQLLK